MIIGVLALQGDFEAHEKRIQALGWESRQTNSAQKLAEVDALVIPGGESSVFLKLLSPELKAGIKQRVADGMPTMTTCAGTILLAKNVTNPEQESLELIDIDVKRNAYGRQVDSFITKKLELSPNGCKIFASHDTKLIGGDKKFFEGVFIRAPKITRIGSDVTEVFSLEGAAVGVAYKNILTLTFHPELSEGFELPYRFLMTADC